MWKEMNQEWKNTKSNECNRSLRPSHYANELGPHLYLPLSDAPAGRERPVRKLTVAHWSCPVCPRFICKKGVMTVTHLELSNGAAARLQHDVNSERWWGQKSCCLWKVCSTWATATGQSTSVHTFAEGFLGLAVKWTVVFNSVTGQAFTEWLVCAKAPHKVPGFPLNFPHCMATGNHNTGY